MTKTQQFYKWWTQKVKGDYIDNKTLERIQLKLDKNYEICNRKI
jgi:hypothetical protein